MDARDFLGLAQTMASMVDAGPARYRTAISRSYYSAFLIAQAFVTRAGLEPLASHNKHAAIKNVFLATTVDTVKHLGVRLDSLHEMRKRADYGMASVTSEQQDSAQAAVTLATQIINGLQGLQGSPGFSKLAADMKTWAQATASSGLRVR